MATLAPHALYGLYALILPKLKTAKNGGIVGNTAHVAGGGYHISREDLKNHGQSGDYSIQHSKDKLGPSNLAAAIDITFNDVKEEALVHGRLRKACEDGDPRVYLVRETIGTLDGKNVSGYNRVASGSGSRSRVGWHSTGWSDDSHLWHEHISILREYVEDANGMLGLAEVILGLPAGALGWKADGTGTAPAWDGKSFPGASAFYVGAHGDYVTLLGQRLVAHGWTGYATGPGPDFSTVDQAAVKWFQEKQGWTGSDADGFPGAQTWALLMATPVVAPPVVVPPVVTPPVTPPLAKGITTPVRFASVNAEWPEYGSVQAKVKAGTAKPWSVRKGILASKLAGFDVVALQELGEVEAAQLAEAMGEAWAYQRLGLNCVFWRVALFDLVKTRELTLPAFGQWPGRWYLEVWLKDKAGNPLRVGSTHLTVKTSNDAANQLAQVKQIVAFAAQSSDPLVIGIDTNNRQAAGTGIWVPLAQGHFSWDRGGIDAILWAFGVQIPSTKALDLGAGSDHDGRTASLTTKGA